MKPLWALVLSVFQFIPLIEPRTYHTRDAITVEGEYGNGDANTEAITHLVFPSATFALTEKTCWTKNGEIGTCLNVRACYPLFNLSSGSFVGRYATCNYMSFGKQFYGICCPLESYASTKKPNVSGNIAEGNFQTQATSTQAEEKNEAYLSTTVSPETSTNSPISSTDFTTTNSTVSNSTTEGYSSLTTKEESETLSAITQPENVDYACGMGPFKYLNVDEQKRIVGGTLAVRNSWPFLVALLKNGRQFCGGSVIDSLRVLTAAHCIAQMSSWDVGRLEVALGMHELQPNYQSPSPLVKIKYNDIAIITLDTPIEYTSIASPVCLPESNDDAFVGMDAVVIGWGSLKEGGSQPSVLQQVTVRVQSNDECKRRYGKDAPGGIAEHMLCASYPGKDACSGDSGGPLIVQSHPGAPWVQAGIVSWGIGCGKPPYPGVYTRVSYFLRWIEANIR